MCIRDSWYAGCWQKHAGRAAGKSLGLRFPRHRLAHSAPGKPHLGRYLHRHGHHALRQLESQSIADLNVQQTVIATGGSAIYGETAMRHLALMGHIVYLRCPLSVLDQRISDMNARGIAAPPGQGLNEVEAERVPLYEQYADATLDVGTQSMEDALDQLLTLIKAR